MPSMQNPALIHLKPPQGEPVIGENLELQDRPMPSEPSEYQVAIEVLYSSLDPYLRGRMRDPSIKAYIPPFQAGNPFESHAVARVTKSLCSGFSSGDLIYTHAPIQRYSNIDPKLRQAKVLSKEITDGIDIRNFIGALGMPGLTAYSSLLEIGKPQAGETIFVSSAAGAVGQIVGQLAKHLGLYVIGSVGSDEKLNYIKSELKFDAGFNYKTEKVHEALPRLLKEAGKQGLDIYYDNVGGEQLDAALISMNTYGRIVACGGISDYNAKTPEERYPQRNVMLVVGKQLTWRGFIVSGKDMGPKWEKERDEKVSQWLRDGSFVAKIHEDDISNAAEAFLGMLRGKNFGKAVLKVSD